MFDAYCGACVRAAYRSTVEAGPPGPAQRNKEEEQQELMQFLLHAVHMYILYMHSIITAAVALDGILALLLTRNCIATVVCIADN
eukprot:9225-Heterococcus_DN1.PRE.5